MSKNINYPLILGGLIVLLLAIISFYPHLFTDKDPLFEGEPKYIEYEEDGQIVEEFAHNPIRPNNDNIWGTDDAGRDLYTRLIYGTRNSLKLVFLIALFRMLIGLPLGLGAGMGIKSLSGIIKIFNTIFTAIPMLIFSYIILNMTYFNYLEMDKAIPAYALVLTFVGWSKLAGLIEDNVRRVMSEDFIQGEIAIGKTRFQIARQNVIPHIIPSSVSLFFKEMAMALFLIAQLAVLYVFVGIVREIPAQAFRSNYDMILEPEWGGTLSRITQNIGRFETSYWLTIYPVLAFTIGVLGLNLFGEGLRVEFSKRDSRVISFIKKVSYQLSPKLFVEQIKDFRENYKYVLAKALIIVGLIAYFAIPWHPSDYDFNMDMALMHLDELSDHKYRGRVSGSEGGYEAGEYIIDTLESYGYETWVSEIPLIEESGQAKMFSPVFIESGKITIKDANGEEKEFFLHEDFSIASVESGIFEEGNREEIILQGIAGTPDRASEVGEDQDFFPLNQNYFYLASWNLGQNPNYHTRFFYYEEATNANMTPYVFDTTTIYPFEELNEELGTGLVEMEIRFDFPEIPAYPARNISGFMPGKGRTKDDPGPIILIGAIYDGIYQGKEKTSVLSASSAATNLEIARILSEIDEPLEKSIEFIFWDNQSQRNKETQLDGSTYFDKVEQKPISMALNQGYYYIDVNYPYLTDKEPLDFIVLPSQRADGNSYLIGLDIEKRLKQSNIKYKRHHYWDYSSVALRELRLNAITSIGVGNLRPPIGYHYFDNIENLNLKTMNNIGQIVIDTLTMEPRIME